MAERLDYSYNNLDRLEDPVLVLICQTTSTKTTSRTTSHHMPLACRIVRFSLLLLGQKFMPVKILFAS
jgi:hypothetical protein